MPAVSVVMPAYNVERYLAESIDSVLRQTFRDFELVIVDDGSTDGSYAIAERYRANHPERIVLVSQNNRGLAERTQHRSPCGVRPCVRVARQRRRVAPAVPRIADAAARYAS